MNNVIGIDLGGTGILAVRADEDGRILARQNAPTPVKEGAEAVLSAMASMAAAVRDEGTVAAGVATPGQVDTRRGSLIGPACNLPGMDKIPLAGRLAETLGMPVFVENDGNAATLGEVWIGAGKGAKICVMITLGTGVGGGVVMGGRIYHGSGYAAAEFGHVSIDWRGGRCRCGGTGCAETLCSANALAAQARKAVAAADGPGIETLIRLSKGDIRNVTAKMVCEAARGGDAFSARLLDEYAVPLAALLSVIINSLNPDRIVIGGGLGLSWDLIGPRVEKELAAGRALAPALSVCRIVAAQLGDESGAVGAARFAWNQVKSTGISVRL